MLKKFTGKTLVLVAALFLTTAFQARTTFAQEQTRSASNAVSTKAAAKSKAPKTRTRLEAENLELRRTLTRSLDVIEGKNAEIAAKDDLQAETEAALSSAERTAIFRRLEAESYKAAMQAEREARQSVEAKLELVEKRADSLEQKLKKSNGRSKVLGIISAVAIAILVFR